MSEDQEKKRGELRYRIEHAQNIEEALKSYSEAVDIGSDELVALSIQKAQEFVPKGLDIKKQ